MKALIFILLIFSCFVGFSQPQVRVEVYFQQDDSKLSKKLCTTLDSLVDIYRENELEKIVLIGHTNSDGSQKYNTELSKSRVDNVQKYLMKVYSQQLFDIGYKGENNPNYDNSTSEGWVKNRRVSVLMIHKPALGNGNPPPMDNNEVFNNSKTLEEVIADLLPKPQSYEIDNQEENILTTQKGVKLLIPRHAFGKEEETVRIEVTEYLTKSDMLLTNLTSQTPNQLLETGGMFYVQAFQGSKKIPLRKPLGMVIPINGEKKKGMETFYGDEQRNVHIQQTSVSWDNNLRNIREGSPIIIDASRSWWVRFVDFLRGREQVTNRLDVTFRKKALENSGLTEEEKLLAENYLLNIGSLGWINCDRFYDVKNKTNLIVGDSPDVNTRILIFFKEMDVIMSPNYIRAKSSIFQDIPKGEKVIVVGLKNDEDQLLLAMEEVVVDSKKVNIKYEKVTKKLLLEKMSLIEK
ncbi:MAG: OmpA family protein [Cytophagales bacterium]|nr:OmpA family protein [Cytophagales bacterium]